MFENIHIVLVNPQSKGNIGASARIIKNFSFLNLRIVGTIPEKEDFFLAAHSEEILRDLTVFDDFNKSIQDLDLKICFSRRESKKNRADIVLWDINNVIKDFATQKIGLIFGRESSGLTAEEVDQCDLKCIIPTNPQQPSINLAQSVAIATYEIHRGILGTQLDKPRDEPASKNIKSAKEEIMNILISNGYFQHGNPEKVDRTLSKILFKSKITDIELYEFVKIFRRMETVIKKNNK